MMMTLDLTKSFIFQEAESLLALGQNWILCLLLFANMLPIQLKFLNNGLFLQFSFDQITIMIYIRIGKSMSTFIHLTYVLYTMTSCLAGSDLFFGQAREP